MPSYEEIGARGRERILSSRVCGPVTIVADKAALFSKLGQKNDEWIFVIVRRITGKLEMRMTQGMKNHDLLVMGDETVVGAGVIQLHPGGRLQIVGYNGQYPTSATGIGARAAGLHRFFSKGGLEIVTRYINRLAGKPLEFTLDGTQASAQINP